MDTSGSKDSTGSAGGGELLTTGQAAAELKDLGITRRQVSRLLDSGELRGIQQGKDKWRRVTATSVRAYRERLLSQLADDQGAEAPP